MKGTERYRIADPITNSTVCDGWSSRRGGSESSPTSTGGSCAQLGPEGGP